MCTLMYLQGDGQCKHVQAMARASNVVAYASEHTFKSTFSTRRIVML